jgi:hypothetical protein
LQKIAAMVAALMVGAVLADERAHVITDPVTGRSLSAGVRLLRATVRTTHDRAVAQHGLRAQSCR